MPAFTPVYGIFTVYLRYLYCQNAMPQFRCSTDIIPSVSSVDMRPSIQRCACTSNMRSYMYVCVLCPCAKSRSCAIAQMLHVHAACLHVSGLNLLTICPPTKLTYHISMSLTRWLNWLSCSRISRMDCMICACSRFR